jgi:hypothetical protein
MGAPCPKRYSWAMVRALVMLTVAASTWVGLGTELAWGQQPRPFEYIQGDRRVTRVQVELGIRFAESARAALSRGDVTDLERAQELAFRSYEFLRYAMHGVELLITDSRSRPYEVQVFRIALAAINEARERNLAAQRAIDNSIPWPDAREQYRTEALTGLGESIPFAQRAALLLK